MQSFPLPYASDGRQALLPDEALRRRALHALARTVGDRVVLFCIVDDHIHVVLLCEAQQAGVLSRELLLALRPLTGPNLAPAFVRPIEGRGHLEWLVRYVLEQPTRHGLPGHPALWPGSCFPDLVGARRLPGLSLRLRLSEALPRFRLRTRAAPDGAVEAVRLRLALEEQARAV